MFVVVMFSLALFPSCLLFGGQPWIPLAQFKKIAQGQSHMVTFNHFQNRSETTLKNSPISIFHRVNSPLPFFTVETHEIFSSCIHSIHRSLCLTNLGYYQSRILSFCSSSTFPILFSPFFLQTQSMEDTMATTEDLSLDHAPRRDVAMFDFSDKSWVKNANAQRSNMKPDPPDDLASLDLDQADDWNTFSGSAKFLLQIKHTAELICYLSRIQDVEQCLTLARFSANSKGTKVQGTVFNISIKKKLLHLMHLLAKEKPRKYPLLAEYTMKQMGTVIRYFKMWQKVCSYFRLLYKDVESTEDVYKLLVAKGHTDKTPFVNDGLGHVHSLWVAKFPDNSNSNHDSGEEDIEDGADSDKEDSDDEVVTESIGLHSAPRETHSQAKKRKTKNALQYPSWKSDALKTWRAVYLGMLSSKDNDIKAAAVTFGTQAKKYLESDEENNFTDKQSQDEKTNRDHRLALLDTHWLEHGTSKHKNKAAKTAGNADNSTDTDAADSSASVGTQP